MPNLGIKQVSFVLFEILELGSIITIIPDQNLSNILSSFINKCTQITENGVHTEYITVSAITQLITVFYTLQRALCLV